MASSTESLLRLELQATNENDGTWGTKNNTNIELLARAIAGHESVAIDGSGSITLSASNYTDDQSREAFLTLTGTLTGNRTVIIPSSSKLYVVRRNTTGNYTVTVKTAAGAGVLIPSGATVFLSCDGTTTFAVGDATERLPLTGGALTGGLALSASTTTSALGVATQGYVETALDAYLPLGGGILTGSLELANASGVTALIIDYQSGGSARVQGERNGSARWRMELGDNSTESGSDAGALFVLRRFADDGVTGNNVMTASRASGLVTFANNVVATGSMTAASYITTSDEKLKTNLTPLEGILEDVERLSPTYFSWTQDAQAKGKGASREVGLLAQQLEVHFPELVHETSFGDETVKGIDYSRLAVLALAAVQELSAKVRRLERQFTGA